MNHITSRIDTSRTALSRLGKSLGTFARNIGLMPGNTITETHRKAVGRLHTGSSRRLTDEERIKLVNMLDAGQSIQAIASELKVSRPTVYTWAERLRPGMHSRKAVTA